MINNYTTKYEYKILKIKNYNFTLTEINNIEKNINNLGEEGWKIISINVDNDRNNLIIFLMREYNELIITS